VRTRPPPTLVRVAGDLDTLSAPQLRAALPTAPQGHLVLDVSGLQFLDAAGLTVLLELHDRLERANKRVVIAAAPGRYTAYSPSPGSTGDS
jgi:anti-sigma B factor antagonist